MSRHKLTFFRQKSDGMVVGQAHVEAPTKEEAKEKFLKDVEEAGVSDPDSFTLD